MATKPTTLPQWATTGGTTVEPSSGQKAAGFAVGTRPPARWVNWLLNNVYTWVQYLDTPVGTAGTSGGAAFSATGGASTTSTGGSGLVGTGGAASSSGTGGTGVYGAGGASSSGNLGVGLLGDGGGTPVSATPASGAGVVGRGGATNGRGGEFFGKGSGNAVRGTADTTGVGVRGIGGSASGAGGQFTGTAGNAVGAIVTGNGSGEGVTATGGTTDGSAGVVGTSGATNGDGVHGTGTGTGKGVYGVGVSGYGVVAESDTTSAAKAALRVVPQDADPSSSPAAGDFYVHTTSGMWSGRKAGSEWVRYVGKVKAITSAITTSIGSDSSASCGSHSIPAGTLRAGSTVRVRIAGTGTSVSGLPSLAVYLGGVAPANFTPQLTNGTNRFEIDEVITIRSVGAAGVAAYVADYDVLNNTTYARRFDSSTYSTIDTTAAVLIDLQGAAGEGGATIQVDTFVVDISD